MVTQRDTNRYDAIVVGGGHNGLVAAAYLAKHGARTVVLEARHKTGGAADTMAPWPEAPDIRVTTLSYVMSLMPPTIQRDLQLERFGYKVHPQGMGYLPHPSGRSIVQHEDPEKTRASVAQFSKKDADAYFEFEEWIGGIANILGPLLMQTPSHLGSKKARDLKDVAQLGWHLRKEIDERRVADITRLFTMSATDLLDRWFESPVLKGFMAVNGIIGTWAGPDAPGTAYVLMHHSVGDIGDGQIASWGYPEGGMGAVGRACEESARFFGAEIRTNARVGRITTSNGRARGVVLDNGEELSAPVVVTAVHPKITFLQHLSASELPVEFVHDIEHWKTRSGTVKINLAVSELPNFTADPGFDPSIHGGAIQILDDVDYLERAFQQARFGEAATLPFSDTAIPTVADKTLAPEGVHVVSMFTQWVPHEWADEDGHEADLDAYADRLIERVNDVAPNFKRSIMYRQVIGPKQMQDEWGLIGGNIFHGELSVDQLFHMRPAPGYADYRTPIVGLYQASSATHAGGGVTGMPGHHCVREILADKALKKLKA
ncbi:MAG: NAD(P)/FAD-dependent oxidoreductase [Actinomycetota bacterium]